ncbi:DHA2 family efflux MFS transporter permease subunit [Limobrevibacterium gyesilva]|uniref:DHA2 family efflux MFS transporter permease subunit n=1 Tax=Limobrevibacterium gyesilva TaxID=2991712 RepID=A0AA42CI26_9PROT|nr:DHA2 family efflux MFS transporter permease subunit [Limobrevibacterium gyesilva]MCW3475460.1 DHA2 family efflux MFS transporter permease subunit [Limobrevibacterium gyesilva]
MQAGAQPGMPKLSWRQWAGFMSMVVGMFMAILDIQIVSASITEIQAGLAASPDEAAWVQTSYLIAEIVMIPLSGWLSRMLSTRVLFTASALGFTLFSALCAMATNLGAMIAFRALQGFIGGAMIPTVFATSFLLFPGAARAQVSVLIGLTATLAPTIGPTLGGWLTQALSWHWLFLINVPVGLAVAASVWRFIDIDRPDLSMFRRFDWFGLALMATFLGSLEYVLEEGNRNDWFQDETICTLAAVATVAGVAFFWRMLSERDPLVELRAFRNVNFAFGCLFSVVIGIGLYGAVYVVPLFLARVRGFDSYEIGKTMFVTGLAMFFFAPVAGRVSKYLDLRWMLAFGLVVFGMSVWWLAHLTSQSSFWELLLPQALRGASMMFLFLPVNQLSLGTLPPSALKNASGLYNLMRNLGGAVGLALIGTISTTRTAIHTLHLQEQVTWARPGAEKALHGMTSMMSAAKGAEAHLAALKRMAMMVNREALTLAYNDVLLLMALCFFLAVPLTFLLVRPKMGGSVEAH